MRSNDDIVKRMDYKHAFFQHSSSAIPFYCIWAMLIGGMLIFLDNQQGCALPFVQRWRCVWGISQPPPHAREKAGDWHATIFFQCQGEKSLQGRISQHLSIGNAFLAVLGNRKLQQDVGERLRFTQGKTTLHFGQTLVAGQALPFSTWQVHIEARGGMMTHPQATSNPAGASSMDSSTSLTQPMSDMSVSEKMLQDWIQDAVERQVELNLDIIASKQLGQSKPTAIPQYRGENGWSGIEQLLLALAFDIGSKDCWSKLGLSPIEGANPTVESIYHRCGFVLFLMQGIETEQWSMEDKASLAKAISIIATARAECLEDLSSTRKARKKARPQDLERWKEIGAGPLKFLRELFPGAKIATQLSKVLNSDPDLTAQTTIPAEEARRTLTALSTGGEQAKDALSRLGNQHWITWAPEHNEALQRCLHGYVDYVKANGTGPTITLVTPFVKPPVGESFGEITDVWTHKILQSKWNKVTKQQVIIQDAMEIVRTGSTGPVVSKKSLLCVTLCPKPNDVIQRVVNWAPTLEKFDTGAVIIIGLRTLQLLEIQHLLSTFEGSAKISWGEASRSAGSSTDHPRLCILLNGAGTIILITTPTGRGYASRVSCLSAFIPFSMPE